MDARFCERCGAVTESPQVVDGHYYCRRCAAELTGGASAAASPDSAPSPSSAPLRDSAAPVEEKIKFRCTGCGALLSSKRVSQKSRLRCPQCRTELFLNPDGSVEPVVKVRQPSTPAAKMGASRPQTGFSREELERALDMQKSSREGPDETAVVGKPPAAAPPPPPPKPAPKGTAAPRKPVPRMRVTRSAIMERYRKMAATLESKESGGLVALVAALLLLPAVFILLVCLNVGGLGRIKDSFKDMAQSVGEAALRLRGLAPKQKQTPSQPSKKEGAQQKQPKKQPAKEGGESVKKQPKQPPEEEKPPVKPPKKPSEKQQPKEPSPQKKPQKPKGAEKGG